MKNVIAAALAAMYLLLVPLCFAGPAITMDMSDMASHHAHAVGSELSHHFGIFSLATNAALEIVAIALAAIALLLAFAPLFSLETFALRSPQDTRSDAGPPWRKRLAWLSLLETSPPIGS